MLRCPLCKNTSVILRKTIKNEMTGAMVNY